MKQHKQKKRVARRSDLLRLRDWLKNLEHRYLNLVKYAEKHPLTEIEMTKQGLINSMTNWQRTKLLRLVRGNVKLVTITMAQEHALLPHWKGKTNV